MDIESTNSLMKRALAVPLSGCEIRPPRLTAPRLEPKVETGIEREARERMAEVERLEKMFGGGCNETA